MRAVYGESVPQMTRNPLSERDTDHDRAARRCRNRRPRHLRVAPARAERPQGPAGKRDRGVLRDAAAAHADPPPGEDDALHAAWPRSSTASSPAAMRWTCPASIDRRASRVGIPTHRPCRSHRSPRNQRMTRTITRSPTMWTIRFTASVPRDDCTSQPPDPPGPEYNEYTTSISAMIARISPRPKP
jgi:hypothetical protein